MLGLFGESVICTNALTGPSGSSEERKARFARHDVVRGKPVLQDLGNDNGRKTLDFFFDETFCDVEAEKRKIEAAFQARLPMRLYFDLIGFEISTYLIERLKVTSKKTSSTGRLVRCDIQVELTEAALFAGGVGIAGSFARAILSPTLRRR